MAKIEKGIKSFFEKILNRVGYFKSADLVSLLGGGVFSQTAQGVPRATSYSTLVNSYTSWVYTTIEKIAKTVSKLPLEIYIYRKNGTKLRDGVSIKARLKCIEGIREKNEFLKANELEKVRVEDHAFIKLMNNPNRIDTRFTLWMNIVIRLELAGYCGVYMPLNSLRRPGELWALPLNSTASLRCIPDKKEVISGYYYQDGSTKVKLELDELMYVKYPNPSSPFAGMSPLLAQQYPYNIDLYLMQQQFAFLRNKGAFGNVFTTEKELKGKQVEELRDQLASQFDGALNTGRSIVTHSGLKLDNRGLAQTTKDMMVDVIAEFSRDKIISAYDVPPAKLGLVKDVNRNTIEVLDRTFITECIEPKTMLIEEQIEKDILPLYDDGVTADFVLPETSIRDLDIKERKINLDSGYTTINEERARKGREPVSWGEEPWFPFNLTQPGSTPPIRGREGEEKNKLLNRDFWTEEKLRKASDNFIKQVESRKNLLVPIVNKHWKDELKGVLERLEKEGKALKGHIAGFGKNKLRVWLKDNKGKLQRININKEEEAKELAEMVEPSIIIIMQDAGDARLTEFGLTKPFNTSDPVVESHLSSRLKMFSKDVEGTTFDGIQAILKEGFQEGLPLTQIGTNLKEKFANWEKWRAQMISRTETISASNFADLEAVKQNDLPLKKFWLNEVDARETHQEAGANYNADGAIDIKKDFFVGADVMDAPANGSLAEENVNCRCTLGYVEK